MSRSNQITARPAVQLIGQFELPEFRDAAVLLRASAQLVTADRAPEILLVAQSRPDSITNREIARHQRRWPLAGAIMLLGSWCEGETRTGRPPQGVQRLYWHEFPTWWRRQLALWSAGRCPDWARRADFGFPAPAGKLGSDCGLGACSIRNPQSANGNCAGVVLFRTACRESAAALTDVVRTAGFATIWQRPGQPKPIVHGASAGIWDGGQLDDREAADLADFCRELSRDAAPVLALLDFPRHDRGERARELGAAAILGKPWLKTSLMGAIEGLINRGTSS